MYCVGGAHQFYLGPRDLDIPDTEVGVRSGRIYFSTVTYILRLETDILKELRLRLYGE